MDRRSAWVLIVCAAGAVMPLGCAQTPRPLTADLFAPAPVAESTSENMQVTETTVTSADTSSPIGLTAIRPLQPQLASIAPLDALVASAKVDTAELQVPPGTSVGTMTPVVAAPATQPSLADVESPAPVPGTSRGVYMSIGGVLAKVNGTPIYSGQVLHKLEKQFAAKARDLSEREFREFAEDEIHRQLEELIQDELYFNLALNSLAEKDRELAEQITIHLKQEKITAAGGSLEAAKRRAEADGQDFDEQMTQTYREIVHDLMQRKVIEPMVQVSAADLRAYYCTNCGKLYDEKSKALFRVIQVDPSALTDRDADRVALEKITAIHQKAADGESFAALAASTDNTDSYLRAHAGDPGGWMEPNCYHVDEVEKAIWQLQPGQVTPVIKADGVYYVAKLVDKKIGASRPFTDPTVQDDIYNRIRQQQIADRWRASKQQSQTDAIVTTSEDRVELAVDLAMQKYKVIQGENGPAVAESAAALR